MSGHTALFIQRELTGALRARWFIAYSLLFLAGGLVLATFGMSDSVIAGYRGFAKAFAGLVHLALLFVPLLALFPATAAIVEERESGAMDYMLAQPVDAGEVFAGKWGGVATAVVLAMTIGVGGAGALAVLRGVPVSLIVLLYGFVVLLALVFVSGGLCFSAVARSRAHAMTLGIVTWLVLVAFGTLGLMLAFVRWGLPEQVLVLWSFLNPVEAFRLGIMSALDPDLSLLGPVGADIIEWLGRDGTLVMTAASLIVWSVVPALVGRRVFAIR